MQKPALEIKKNISWCDIIDTERLARVVHKKKMQHTHTASFRNNQDHNWELRPLLRISTDILGIKRKSKR